MKNTISISLLALLILTTIASGQDTANPPPNAPSSQTTTQASGDSSEIGQPVADPPSSSAIDPVPVQPAPATRAGFGFEGKFRYYLAETYFNPSAVTAPAFRAGLRMANPPGKRATQYPAEWRQGAEAFGRNYGDAFAERVSFQTARFVTGAITREDPRYIPSSSSVEFRGSRRRWICRQYLSSRRLWRCYSRGPTSHASVRILRGGESVPRVCATDASAYAYVLHPDCPLRIGRPMTER
jgi:hypothetical protein